jgi:hypothetical protein
MGLTSEDIQKLTQPTVTKAAIAEAKPKKAKADKPKGFQAKAQFAQRR